MQSKPVARHYPGRDLEAMTFAVNYHRWIIQEFAPYVGEVVAEVGAGNGSVSQLLLERNPKSIHAFEPSDNLYPTLAKALNHDARAQAIHDFFSARDGQKFDTIIYINVLEHIDDDRSELATAFAALNPGGHLLVFVPALSWLYSRHDKDIGHFRRYSKAELVAAVADVGFGVVKARYFDVAGIIPWYLNFVVLRNSVGEKSVALYDHWIVPLMSRVESVLTPPIGKNILLVGRKA